MMLWRLLAAFALAWIAFVPGAMAQNPGVARADAFIARVVPVCSEAASTACYETAFAATDRDADAFLSLIELEDLKADLRAWTDANWSQLIQVERNALTLGFFVLDAIGLAPLFRTYDANRDDLLSRDELSADIRLDARPLEEVVRDREAIDWAGLRQRLGSLSSLVEPFTTPR